MDGRARLVRLWIFDTSSLLSIQTIQNGELDDKPAENSKLTVQAGTKKVRAPQEQAVSLGPQVAEGENVFGVAHIFAS